MYKSLTRDSSTGRFKSTLINEEIPIARIIGTIPSKNENTDQIYNPEITSWQQARECAWCGNVFYPKYVAMKKQRFCGTSCSAKWRMSKPEIYAKVHNPEINKKRGLGKAKWYRSGDPKALKEIERVRNLNPMKDKKIRDKVSKKLKEIGHKPHIRGGNGKGMTVPQEMMYNCLIGEWIPEYAISLGKREEGYPTCYKVDLGNPCSKIAIEVDGPTHRSRKHLDYKKDDKLSTLGWKVLRFWNKDIIEWVNSGMVDNHNISQQLNNHNILFNRFKR